MSSTIMYYKTLMTPSRKTIRECNATQAKLGIIQQGILLKEVKSSQLCVRKFARKSVTLNLTTCIRFTDCNKLSKKWEMKLTESVDVLLILHLYASPNCRRSVLRFTKRLSMLIGTETLSMICRPRILFKTKLVLEKVSDELMPWT
jgi:hypothetical protein